MRTAITAIALLALSCAAGAQVYKCPDSAGKITYSQSACAGGTRGLPISGGTTSGINAMSQREIQRSMRPEPQPQAPQAPQAFIMGQGGNAPTSQEIKNLETSASSITKDKKERNFLKAEVERAKAAQSDGEKYTAQDWTRINEAQSAQSRIDAKDRQRAREAAEAVHSAKGSQSVRQQIEADRQAEDARVAARRAAAADQAARAAQASQPRIASCNGPGCWVGTEHLKKGSDGTYYGASGACRRIGDQLHC